MKRIIFVFITLSLFCLSCCGKKPEEPFVVKIGSEKVYEQEFRFYFLLSQLTYEKEGGTDIWLTSINGAKAEDVAKDRTFESIARIKISYTRADSLGISLTEENRQIARDMAEYYRTALAAEDLEEIGITDEQLWKIMEDTIVFGKVYDEITGNVNISERDFNTYIENYLADSQDGLVADDDLYGLYEGLRQQYEQKIKNEVFAGEYTKWEAETEIEKNMELWDAIHILNH